MSKCAHAMRIHICCLPAYKFDGWYFTFSQYLGVDVLNKDGSVRKVQPVSAFHPFWEAFRRWTDLPESEREKYRAE